MFPPAVQIAGAAMNTCYVSCSPTPTGILQSPPASHIPASAPPVAHALAFTGADLAEVFVLAVIAITIGCVMWVSSRRRA